MGDEIVLAFSTFPDLETARRVAVEIVDLRLAACGNIVPQIHSVYRWQGKMESSEEALAIFKLAASRYAEFETKLRSLHPYEVPEIICCKVGPGLPQYLQWVTENCR
ncbi:MAG TPA: divalent-cation tolerance protein CutA [Chthoniobacterales bacterium]